MEGFEQGVDLTLLLLFNYSGYYMGNRWCVGGGVRVEDSGVLTLLQVRETSSHLTAFELYISFSWLRLQLKHWLLLGLEPADSSCRSWDVSLHNGSPNPQYLSMGLYLKIGSLKRGDYVKMRC